MVKLVVSAFLLLMVMMQSARAENGGPLAEAMRKDPARFQAMAEDVIAGYGGPSGLTPAGIEDHVTLERAAARASAQDSVSVRRLGSQKQSVHSVAEIISLLTVEVAGRKLPPAEENAA